MINALAVIGGLGVVLIICGVLAYAFLEWLSWNMRV